VDLFEIRILKIIDLDAVNRVVVDRAFSFAIREPSLTALSYATRWKKEGYQCRSPAMTTGLASCKYPPTRQVNISERLCKKSTIIQIDGTAPYISCYFD
jgi:hypothetical protein